MGRFAQYCDTKQKAHQLLLQARLQNNTHESTNRTDMSVIRSNVYSLLEHAVLSDRDIRALTTAGINVSLSSFQNDVVSKVCNRLLLGLQESYSVAFSGIFSSSVAYASLFAHATDIESASLSGPDGISNQSLMLKSSTWSSFLKPTCYVCNKPFKGISFRTTLRRHVCRNCGKYCCASCCATKIFCSVSDTFIDVCIKCTLAIS